MLGQEVFSGRGYISISLQLFNMVFNRSYLKTFEIVQFNKPLYNTSTIKAQSFVPKNISLFNQE